VSLTKWRGTLVRTGLAGLIAEFGKRVDEYVRLRANSVRFAVIGDAGTGDKVQNETASQIFTYYKRFPFTFAIMLGDNIYGASRPQDFAKKFERPYKPLLDAKVEFDAALGNHDDPNRFFVLDSNYLEPEQVKWLEQELAASGSDWKIAYFHHEHIYERIVPQKGIQYFVAGGAAILRSGDTRPGKGITEVGFASDRSFMLVEVAGNELFFQAISRTGATVDKGTIRRRVGTTPPKVTAVKPGVKPPTTPPAKKPVATAAPKPGA